MRGMFGKLPRVERNEGTIGTTREPRQSHVAGWCFGPRRMTRRLNGHRLLWSPLGFFKGYF